MAIKKETVISLYESQVTLMQWLIKVEKALKDDSLEVDERITEGLSSLNIKLEQSVQDLKGYINENAEEIAELKAEKYPSYENITVDNGTSGLYVNAQGNAGLTYQSGDLSADVRIEEGVPEMINRSEGYQASLLVGTQDIEIERKDIEAGTTERKSLFGLGGTKLYQHYISLYYIDFGMPVILKIINTIPNPYENVNQLATAMTQAVSTYRSAEGLSNYLVPAWYNSVSNAIVGTNTGMDREILISSLQFNSDTVTAL